METVAHWVLMLDYLFLFLALGTSIFSIIKRRNASFALMAAMIVITIPPVSIINSIGRSEKNNEFEHLLHSIQHGEIWSTYVVIGYLFSIVWLLIFFFSRRAYSDRK